MSALQIYTFLCLGQENTGIACLQLLLSCCPGSQLSLLLQKHRRRCSATNKTELLAPASPPVMFLKNILIDVAISQGKSQRRSPGTSAEEDSASPGKFISTLPSACHDVWLVLQPELTAENTTSSGTDCSVSPRERARLD